MTRTGEATVDVTIYATAAELAALNDDQRAAFMAGVGSLMNRGERPPARSMQELPVLISKKAVAGIVCDTFNAHAKNGALAQEYIGSIANRIYAELKVVRRKPTDPMFSHRKEGE